MLLNGLLRETGDLISQNKIAGDGQVSKAIGYRQAIQYLSRENPVDNDCDEFSKFLTDFTGSTRRYAKKQMQWFRRDDKFVFIPVDLDQSAAASNESEKVSPAGECRQKTTCLLFGSRSINFAK